VTLVMIVLCNLVLLCGFSFSGVNLDELARTPDLFDSKSDVCLRLTWQQISGAMVPIRVCSEWINLSDSSGKTHVLDRDARVRKGADGLYYFDRGIRADYRLAGFVGFVGAVIACGLVTRRYLVSRYRGQLELAAGRMHQ
jgi:hypothetical protein